MGRKNILVTGGNGFIGRYVVEELLRRDHDVTVLDTRWRQPDPFFVIADDDKPELRYPELVLGDIRDATSTTEAIAHVDGVIHLAGVLGTQETIDNPRPAAETNVLGGLNVLEACAQYDIPLVNIAVGNYWMNNTYSITKNTVERFVDMFVRFRGTRMTVVRALNAYGPRQVAAAPFGPSKVRKIMPSFICRALTGEPIEIYGDGEQVMDMIYVEDVADVLVTALEWTSKHGAYRGETLEAGTGIRTTVNDIAAEVVQAVAHQAGVQTEVRHLPMRPGEDEKSVVLGNPDTLLGIDIQAESFMPLKLGTNFTVAHFKARLGV